jgi:5-methylcytosine-specific restriction endonuclease McrA
MKTKKQHRAKAIRKPTNAASRLEILSKTDGLCHICGGEIDGAWHADHVHPHSRGGKHDIANYLPAHQICNSSRKGFDPEEIQWILKLGVWLKTQIENETNVGLQAAEKFCIHERRRADRCVK